MCPITTRSEPVRVYLVAGEPSGDVIGARLIEALRGRTGGALDVRGVGGPEMASAGMTSLFPYGELAIMGLTEVIPSIPRILRRMREVARDIEAFRPDVLVTIDAPSFVFGVLKRLPEGICPRVHYVAPQVWAWRAGRVHKYAKRFDRLLTLFSFEPPYFEAVGLPTTFVGHPAVEGGLDRGDGPGFRARHGIAPDARVLCVLPGSRRGEVARLGDVLSETVRRVCVDRPDLRIVIPAAANVAQAVRELVSDWPGTPVVVEGVAERIDAFAAADLALAASGTVTLELARVGVPTVVVYRVSRLTGAIARRMIRVRYASMANILADEEVFPEFLQHNCRAELVSPAAGALLDDPQARREMGEAARKAAARGIEIEGIRPSEAAADAVLDVVARHHGR